MASIEKPKEQKQEAKKPEEIKVMLPENDREYIAHMKRHDMQEKKDKELAAMLQANWKKIADAEHRTHH